MYVFVCGKIFPNPDVFVIVIFLKVGFRKNVKINRK